VPSQLILLIATGILIHHNEKTVFSFATYTISELIVMGFNRLDGLNANNSTFAEYQGKLLLINIWVSWCPPCRAEKGSVESRHKLLKLSRQQTFS